jgi:hypothetical protein
MCRRGGLCKCVSPCIGACTCLCVYEHTKRMLRVHNCKPISTCVTCVCVCVCVCKPTSMQKATMAGKCGCVRGAGTSTMSTSSWHTYTATSSDPLTRASFAHCTHAFWCRGGAPQGMQPKVGISEQIRKNHCSFHTTVNATLLLPFVRCPLSYLSSTVQNSRTGCKAGKP